MQLFWQEFVRRRVVRVAVFYGALAWVTIQLADIVLEAFDSDYLLRYVVAAAFFGFPVALVLSWMFDITPQGIQRTPPPMPDEEARRSVAVLPFANYSDDPGNEYFSDGLAEEIRDQLARVPGLRVAARTSSFAFKGRNEDAREIGRRLDVGLILEGGVRKHNDTVRISAQLVDAYRGYQLWSETFERRLEDVFKVQSEISRSILDAVHLRVLDHGAPAGTTADFEAYNLYLLGRHHFHKRSESALNRAVECFKRAIERDPQYALAYSGLADAMSLLGTGFYGNLPAAESIAGALPAAERAMKLAPQSAEAHASMGLIRHTQQDLDGAVRALERAIAINPSYALAYVWLGMVLVSQGRYREAAMRNEEVLRLDPLSPIVNANAGFDAVRFGRDKDAEKHFRNTMELDPGFAVAYSGMARLRARRGALDEAYLYSSKAVERAPTRAFYLARKGFIYLQIGRLELAGEWLSAALQHSTDSVLVSDALLALAICADDRDRLVAIANGEEDFDASQRALVAWMSGDEERARIQYEEYCPDYPSLVRDVVNDDWLWRFPHSLNRAHLRMRHGEAKADDEILQLLAKLEELWAEGIVNADTRYWAAAGLAILGRLDEALATLDKAIDLGWRNVWWARRDPNLASISGDPRCEAALARTEKLVNASAGGILS
ncbi:MAG: tetratricopeptide repeat protein [Woeseiaceae bacterium]